MVGDRPRHHRLDLRHERRLAEPSVGKSRIVWTISTSGPSRRFSASTVRPPSPELNTTARNSRPNFSRHGNPIAPQVEELRAERLTTNCPARQRPSFHAKRPAICRTLRRARRSVAPPDATRAKFRGRSNARARPEEGARKRRHSFAVAALELISHELCFIRALEAQYRLGMRTRA